ncbi:MAG TPA: glycoside hydrolase family 3 N-terminal domain-containing protein, partial [Aggregatilineales bacterium]|nr:glycoside hydrolase family 3 N-terminal domain-containing protein [Aggregatilineales bacterium]
MALPSAWVAGSGRPPTNTPIPSPTASGPTNTPTAAGCTSGADCDSKMTLAEKEGQMAQVHYQALTSNTDITTYALGSLLSGGGEGPSNGNTAQDWFNMVNNFQNYALQTRLHIPLLYGVDAVHGHNNVYGSVVFPHHSGMGATHDTALITQAEQVTRDEVLGTAFRWVFSPCICTPQDDRWGRTYEG